MPHVVKAADTLSFDDFVAKQSKMNGSDVEAETAEVIRFRNSRVSGDTLSFKGKADDAHRGHSTRPVLSRKLAVEHCTFVRDAIKRDPTIDTIEYEESIADITVTRFIACISSVTRSTLPTHDVAEVFDAKHQDFLATKIEWAMQELEDLYIFACTIKALDVCDMIIDRLHEELHHPEQRLIRTADGTMTKFSILYLSPAFINLLKKKDEKGFAFFTDALAMKAEHTLELLNTSWLDRWNQQVKSVLIDRLESGVSSEASKNESAAMCSRYHHHENSEKACYGSKVPTAPLVLVSNVAQQPGSAPRTSKKRVEPNQRKNRGKDEKNKAWKLQHERYDDLEEDVESSDSSNSSDNEDCHKITVDLPQVYTRARDLFRSSDRGYGVPFEYTERASESTLARLAAQDRDGSNYFGDGMDLLKDTAGMQRKKAAIVLKKLRMFRDSGYNPDDIEASEGPSDMSQMSDEDFEMMDADESDYDD